MIFLKSVSFHFKFEILDTANAVYLGMVFILLSLYSCNSKPIHMNTEIDVQGHRGCRGLRPENTIMAFKRAIDIGVNTLELDVVVNRNHDIIVSHEPFFNHEISTGPNGESIDEANEKKYNIYEMSLHEIQLFDVGLKKHPRFSTQKKVKAIKPSLREMVDEIENYVRSNNFVLPEYNIEIKRVKENDGIFHPDMTTFADVVCKEIIELGIAERTTVQCFDVETLQYVHIAYPQFRLVLLIENRQPFERNIKNLGFKPWAYSPYFKLISHDLIDYCKREKIKVIPWTVNEEKDILRMMEFGVDGIISDYPDRVVELIEGYKDSSLTK